MQWKKLGNIKGKDAVFDFDAVKQQIFDSVYPVGSLYISVLPATQFDPNKVFGGIWQRISPSAYLYTTTSDQNIGKNVGNSTYRLVASKMPQQTITYQTLQAGGNDVAKGSGYSLITKTATIGNATPETIAFTPYAIATAAWKRTA